MPPGGKAAQLPSDLIALIGSWIDAGAPFEETTKAAESEYFDRHIRPVLQTSCVGCHGASEVKRAGLDLTTREGLIRGGDNGPAAVVGKAAESSLIKHIKHETKPGMPLQGPKLSSQTIGHFETWINAGAAYSAGTLKFTGDITQTEQPRKPHWAFVPPKMPTVPAPKKAAWVRNSIDSFLAANYEKLGLQPLPEADKRVLLRRVYIDLIGLPPTRDEMQSFLADRSPNAYETVVDRLLQDPRYGERWGRHWMDIWRYSDAEGPAGRVDYSQRHMWQWRNWIIDSLNQDKGYDRMVTEMLAADEIAPADRDTLRATGFLARSWFRYNRHNWLQDAVDHTATAFLGVTLRCARCHEHKYDPVQQVEYYRFRAFFEPYDVRVDYVPGQPDLNKNGITRAFETEPREALPDTENPGVLLPAIFGSTHRFIRGDESNPDEEALAPGVPAAFGGPPLSIRPVTLPAVARYPAIQPFVHDDMRKAAQADITKAEGKLARAERVRTYARGRANGGAVPQAAASSGTEPTVSFEKDLRPLFEKRCAGCHNPITGRSGLSLDTAEAVLAGGNRSGPAAIPGNSEASPLLQYLRGEKSPRMPMTGDALSPKEIKMIATWVDQLPQEEPAVALRKAEGEVMVAKAELEAARANLPALEARISADKAKFDSAESSGDDAAAEKARRLERQAHVLRAEAGLLRAQLALSEALRGAPPTDEKSDKEREKKIAVARRDLDAAQKALSSSRTAYTPLGQVYPGKSSGRRTALAAWIVSPENPLAARVAVNHMWLRHFGAGLVPTVDNFGLSGTKPWNQDLLDWLALKLIQEKWSMKAMHRLMVTSSAYRMQSNAPASHPNRKVDPDNRHLWRMNARRMEAEAVRDAVLYLSGRLDPKIGGPEEQDINTTRRAMYFRQTAYGLTEFMRVFDAANPAECYQRTESVVPQQALALANSAVSLVSARVLTAKLSATNNAAEFVKAAFETTLGRPPSPQESARALVFLREQADLLGQTDKLSVFGADNQGQPAPSPEPVVRARENLVHVLFNHNDFVTIR
jgi:cytochrome c553